MIQKRLYTLEPEFADARCRAGHPNKGSPCHLPNNAVMYACNTDGPTESYDD